MNDQFKTISGSTKGLYKEKGSKFLAFAIPVTSDVEIKDHLARLRKKYHDARHHCFAWRLGAEMVHYRINDDGEPSGSAGNPIFGQIQSRELTNILVVVVRYFGGTLLGVGGLIKAYRSATSDALGKAKIIEENVNTLIQLTFDYARMNEVMKVIKDFGLEFQNQQFDLECTLRLKIWRRISSTVIAKLSVIQGCKLEEVG